MKRKLLNVGLRFRNVFGRNVLIITFFILFSQCSLAAIRNWNGAGVTGGTGGTDFNASPNWLPVGALAAADDLFVSLNDNSTNIVTLSANLTVNSLSINETTAGSGGAGKAFTLSLATFTFTTNANFSITNSAAGANFNRTFDINILLPSTTNVLTVGGNLSCVNANTAVANNTIQFSNSGTVNVNGSSSFNSLNTGTASGVFLLVDNFPASYTFNGAVTLDVASVTSNKILIGSTAASTTGRFIFKNNLLLGDKGATNTLFTAGTVLFDAVGTQTITYNNSIAFFRIPNLIVGSTNNPTVVLAGTIPVDNITLDLTINGSSILNLNSRQLNRNTNGGNFLLKNTAQLLLGASASVANGGTATLNTGNNFPSGFTNIVLDSTTTVEYNGAAQIILGIGVAPQNVSSYGNLTLTIANTKTLGSNIAVFRKLSIGANTTMALGNFNATLKSNNQTTAYISEVPTTASITYGTGRFDIERYLPAFKAWRFLATPIQSMATDATSPTISAAWREGNSVLTSTGFGTQITGPIGPFGAAGVLDVATQRGSLKSYNAATNNFVEIANANTTSLANNEGYFVFVRGDRAVGVGGATSSTNLRMKGKILTGDQVFTVPVNKFQSFGNPYPSRIDFRTVTKSTVNESFYVWNPNPTGTIYNAGKYEVYVKDPGDGNYKLNGGGATRNYIESGQAVFIQSITGGSITVKESDKFGGSSVVSRGGAEGRTGLTQPTIEINLHTNDVNGNSILADAALVNLDNTYSNDIDNMDVKKISNSSDNLSILSNTQNLVAERRSNLITTDTIKLSISGMRAASYRLEINPSVLDNMGLDAFLKDKFLQIETPISLTDITNVNFNVTANAASYAADRFMIVFKTAPIYSSAINKIGAIRSANKSVLVNWEAALENNVTNQQIEKSNDGITFVPIENKLPENNGVLSSYNFVDINASMGDNYYRIKSIRANGSFTYSDVAKVGAMEDLHDITVTPNPIESKTIHFTLNNLPLGKYNLQIISATGSKIFTQSLNHTAENNLYKVYIDNFVTGKYEMVLIFEKKSYPISIFIK